MADARFTFYGLHQSANQRNAWSEYIIGQPSDASAGSLPEVVVEAAREAADQLLNQLRIAFSSTRESRSQGGSRQRSGHLIAQPL